MRVNGPNGTLLVDAEQMANNITSSVQSLQQAYGLSVQSVWDSTVAGSLKLQASINYVPETGDGNWDDIPNSSHSITTASSFTWNVGDVYYPYLRQLWVSTATGAQTITTVADTAGSLNSKYFLIQTANNAINYYVWMNVNSAGVDPAVSGATGVEVALATGATAATAATAIASALDALAGFVSTALSTVVTCTNASSGPFLPAYDSASAPTGFTFAATTGSGLLTTRLFYRGF